jgi:hypothetical protein
MSTHVLETEAEAKTIVNEIRVNSYIHNISCIYCDTIVTECDVALIGNVNFPGVYIIPSNANNLPPVEIHRYQLFAKTGGIELSTRVLKIVGLEITYLSPPTQCQCIGEHEIPTYQLLAIFPLCEHNTGIDESSSTVMSFMKHYCPEYHTNVYDNAEREINISMIYNKEDNTWESRPEPVIKLPCNNLVKSAMKT